MRLTLIWHVQPSSGKREVFINDQWEDINRKAEKLLTRAKEEYEATLKKSNKVYE